MAKALENLSQGLIVKKNILVTGAGGQLGSELRQLSRHIGENILFADIFSSEDEETIRLDITDSLEVERFFKDNDIGIVVNCAAYTNVEKAEEDEISANLVNNIGASALASAAKSVDATLIHISTDYVFDGKSSVPYSENDRTSPCSVYGLTKLAGERAIAASGCKSIIIRTAWLYSVYGKNFVSTMRRLTAEKDSLNVVFDQIGSPTNAADLAQLIIHIITTGQTDKTGIYHYTDEGVCSWYDFAVEICHLSENECDVRPCLSEEFPTKAVRPHYSVLDKSKVKRTFGIVIPYWKDSLKKYFDSNLK